MNNLLIGPDAQARFVLQSLKTYEGAGKIERGKTHVMDGVFFSNDPNAEVQGKFVSRKSEMLSLCMKPVSASPPRWQALHLQLGELNLTGALLFGVAIKSQAPSSTTARLCLRSGQDREFLDTFLTKTLVSFSEPSVHLDVIEIDKTPDLPRKANWRDLILFFRVGEVELDLQDIRLFVL